MRQRGTKYKLSVFTYILEQNHAGAESKENQCCVSSQKKKQDYRQTGNDAENYVINHVANNNTSALENQAGADGNAATFDYASIEL